MLQPLKPPRSYPAPERCLLLEDLPQSSNLVDFTQKARDAVQSIGGKSGRQFSQTQSFGSDRTDATSKDQSAECASDRTQGPLADVARCRTVVREGNEQDGSRSSFLDSGSAQQNGWNETR